MSSLCREGSLRQGLREAEAGHNQLQADYLAAAQDRASLQSVVEEQRSTIASLTDQLCRYKTIEQSLFDEKQLLQSQLEALKEEKCKLAKVYYNNYLVFVPSFLSFIMFTFSPL